MIYLIIQYIMGLGIHLPKVFTFSSARMLFAAITTLGFTIIFGKAFIKKLYELRIGHTIRIADVPVLAAQYDKSRDVPSMGGILFLTAILLSAFLWMDLSHSFTWILISTTLSMGALGAVDDYYKLKKIKGGVSPRKKMICMLLFASSLSLYLYSPMQGNKQLLTPPSAKIKIEGEMKTLTTREYALHYFIPFCKQPIVLSGIGIALACIFTLFVISGSANAVNLTDGLDGLASGLALLVALVLAIIAFISNHVEIADYLNILYIEGSSEIGIFLCAMMGACLGFLWFNSYPAQVFMGDTGSLALGGILGVSAILLRRELLFAGVSLVFVAETLSVILQVWSFRYRGGKRIFRCAPLHHHFEMQGMHEAKIVLRFWMMGLLLALIGLASLKLQ